MFQVLLSSLVNLLNVFLVWRPNLSLNLLLLLRWLQLLPVQPYISSSTLVVSLYFKSCTLVSFLFHFAWHFCPQVLPNQSICICYLFVFNNCNYTLLLLRCCPSLLNNTGIRVCPLNFGNSSLFIATCKISQSSRYVSAASFVCKDPISLGNSLLH